MGPARLRLPPGAPAPYDPDPDGVVSTLEALGRGETLPPEVIAHNEAEWERTPPAERDALVAELGRLAGGTDA